MIPTFVTPVAAFLPTHAAFYVTKSNGTQHYATLQNLLNGEARAVLPAVRAIHHYVVQGNVTPLELDIPERWTLDFPALAYFQRVYAVDAVSLGRMAHEVMRAQFDAAPADILRIYTQTAPMLDLGAPLAVPCAA